MRDFNFNKRAVENTENSYEARVYMIAGSKRAKKAVAVEFDNIGLNEGEKPRMTPRSVDCAGENTLLNCAILVEDILLQLKEEEFAFDNCGRVELYTIGFVADYIHECKYLDIIENKVDPMNSKREIIDDEVELWENIHTLMGEFYGKVIIRDIAQANAEKKNSRFLSTKDKVLNGIQKGLWKVVPNARDEYEYDIKEA